MMSICWKASVSSFAGMRVIAIMEEIIILFALLCFVNEGAPFTGNREKLENSLEDVQSIFVDIGSNLTLPCRGPNVGTDVMWIRNGLSLSIAQNTEVRQDGSLFFQSLHQSDSGLYMCRSDSSDDTSSDNNNDFGSSRRRSERPATPFLIRVRTPPLGLNVTVTPSTIYALVMWEVRDNGGYPITSFQIRYRLENETEDDWKSCQPNLIHRNRRQFEIYHLKPNSIYLVEMWANNQLGKGQSTIITISTHNDLQEIELGKHLLEGVDTFDTRAWVVAVGVVMGTLLILGVATCCLFYKEYSATWADSGDIDGESIELMPNIILNPAYDFPSMELLEPDENSNDTTPIRVNNNSVIYPARV